MRKTASFLVLAAALHPIGTLAGSLDCRVVGSEYSDLMQRGFLESPGEYVKVVDGQFNQADFGEKQRGVFFAPESTEKGIGIIRTTAGTHGRFRFEWLQGYSIVRLSNVVLFPDVEDGTRPLRYETHTDGDPIDLYEGCGLDFDNAMELVCDRSSGKIDLWHTHTPEWLRMESVNSAKMSFPVESLCAGRHPEPSPTEPVPIPTFRPRPVPRVLTETQPRIDCSLAYDEVSSFMNREFLLRPGDYVPLAEGYFTRSWWEDLRGEFHMQKPYSVKNNRVGWSPEWAVALGRTGDGLHYRFRFRFAGGALEIRELLRFRNPAAADSRTVRPCELDAPLDPAAPAGIDLDECVVGPGEGADLRLERQRSDWVIRSARGATVRIPLQSSCGSP